MIVDYTHPPVPAPRIQHECVIAAAAYYNLPPELIVAIREQEGGTLGVVTQHPNGARDMGPMQINEQHLRLFARFGVSPRALTNNECVNLFAGAYILAREVQSARQDIWKAVGNYHSHTPRYHWRYRAGVATRLEQLRGSYGAYFVWLRQSAGNVRAAYLKAGTIGR